MMILINLKVDSSESFKKGGVLYVDNSICIIKNSTFLLTKAAEGGLIFSESSKIELINCYSFRSISINSGGVIFAEQGEIFIKNSKFNSGVSEGNLIYKKNYLFFYNI